MNPPFTPYSAASPNFSSAQSPSSETPSYGLTSTPTPGRGRPRGALTGTGAKRGRKPRGGSTLGAASPRLSPQESLGSTSPSFASQPFSHVHWAMPTGSMGQTGQAGGSTTIANGSGAAPQGDAAGSTSYSMAQPPQTDTSQPQQSQTPQPSQLATPYSTLMNPASGTTNLGYSLPSGSMVPPLDTTGLISMSRGNAPIMPVGSAPMMRPPGVDDDGEGEDDVLPAMADDDYSAQLSWQSQSKDNLKVLMDNFSPTQYERFEAYRRHALPKQAVRKVIQQTLGQQVSQPVAQIVAGFAKVFVGEIVEKARAVQTRRGDSGPLSPDHLREAYRSYQEETGRVGAARPLRSKKLFVR